MKNLRVELRHPDAVLPKYTSPGSAGLDLVAIGREIDRSNKVVTYSTGVHVFIPEGHVGFIIPKGTIYKTVLELTNSIGTITSSFRREIKLEFRDVFSPSGDSNDRMFQYPTSYYRPGDIIGQLVIVPVLQLEAVDIYRET